MLSVDVERRYSRYKVPLAARSFPILREDLRLHTVALRNSAFRSELQIKVQLVSDRSFSAYFMPFRTFFSAFLPAFSSSFKCLNFRALIITPGMEARPEELPYM